MPKKKRPREGVLSSGASEVRRGCRLPCLSSARFARTVNGSCVQARRGGARRGRPRGPVTGHGPERTTQTPRPLNARMPTLGVMASGRDCGRSATVRARAWPRRAGPGTEPRPRGPPPPAAATPGPAGPSWGATGRLGADVCQGGTPGSASTAERARGCSNTPRKNSKRLAPAWASRGSNARVAGRTPSLCSFFRSEIIRGWVG